MLTTAQLEQRRAAGRSRAKAFDTAYQQAARARLTPEQLQLGGQATVLAQIAKYGPAVHARRVARWRKTHPSGLALTVAGWLDAAFILYELEVELVPGLAYGDIVPRLDERLIDVEVDSTYYHGLPGRAEHDAARDELVRAAGYTVIRLPEADIASGAAKEVLSQILGITL